MTKVEGVRKIYSIKEICEGIWEIEKKYDLFTKKVDNIFFWKLIRFKIYLNIANSIGTLSISKEKISLKNKVLYVIKGTYNSISNSALKGDHKRDVLIFENPRKVLVDNKYIDPYTHYFVECLEQDGKNYEIIARPYKLKHMKCSTNKRKYKEITILDLIKYKYVKINLTDIDRMLFNKISEEIYNRFQIFLDVEKTAITFLKRFKVDYRYYYKLLNRRAPQNIYLVASYGFEALISAAKDSKITVTEIQHGIISKYHLGYSFPGVKEVPYFPDRMKMFGEYWYNTTPIPLGMDKVEFWGFEYLNRLINKYKSNDFNKNQILFISQPSIGKKLYSFAYCFAEKYKEYNIIFRLHPKEVNSYINEEREMKLSNFSFDRGKTHLYEQINKSEYVVGVSSTAIFEAIMFDRKIIIINLSTAIYLDSLNNMLPIINTESEMIQTINMYRNDLITIDKNMFFARGSIC